MELLLAVAEDSATLRSDMSAVYGVGGESDATSLSFLRPLPQGGAGYAGAMQALHPASQVFVPPSMRCTIRITLPGKPQSGKPRVRAEPGEPKALTRSSPCASAWTLDRQ